MIHRLSWVLVMSVVACSKPSESTDAKRSPRPPPSATVIIPAGVHVDVEVDGVASPAVDAMIAAILAAESEEDFIAAARALDRALISGFYIAPLYYAREEWIAYSAALGRPERTPLFGVDLAAWWRKTP